MDSGLILLVLFISLTLDMFDFSPELFDIYFQLSYNLVFFHDDLRLAIYISVFFVLIESGMKFLKHLNNLIV